MHNKSSHTNMHKTSRNERRLLVNNTRDINSSKVEAVILVINHHCRVSCNHQSRIDIAYLLALNRRRKTELSVRRMLCVVLVGTGRTCTGTAVVVVVHLCWLRLSFVCHHSLSRCNLLNSTFPISLSTFALFFLVFTSSSSFFLFFLFSSSSSSSSSSPSFSNSQSHQYHPHASHHIAIC